MHNWLGSHLYSIENLTLNLAWSPKPAWVDFILGTDPSPQLLVPWQSEQPCNKVEKATNGNLS